jgi:hypothetical protein
MSRTTACRVVLAAAAGGAGLLAVYVRCIRPRTMRWGATDEEVARPLPGDEVVAGPGFRATRAITIQARPEHIWPWLLQIGSGRAGWYSYDRIDNGGVPSAQTIAPEIQPLTVGDFVPMVVGEQVGVWVRELEPNRRMLWWDRKGEFTWEWVLDPIDDRSTRLISRIRETYPPLLSPRMLYAIVASTGDIVMTRKQLRGIKARAERLARPSGAPGRPVPPDSKEMAS